MKKIFSTALFLCVSWAASASAPEQIMAFYRAYMENTLNNEATANAELCRQYMTRSLIRRMEHAARATDVDHIIRAQDVNETGIETLSVRPLGNDWYMVGYFWTENDPKSIVEIPVKAAGDPIRIMDITPILKGNQHGGNCK